MNQSRYRLKPAKIQRPFMIRLIPMLVFLLVVLFGAVSAWRIATRANELHTSLLGLESFLRDSPELDAWGTLEQGIALFEEIHTRSIALREETQLILPFAPLLHPVPSYGPDVAASEHLFDVLINTSAALVNTGHATQRIFPSGQRSDLLDQAVFERIRESRAQFEQAQLYTSQAIDALAHVPVDELSPSVRNRMNRIEPLLPLLNDGLELVLAASDVVIAISPAYEAWERSPTISSTMIRELHTTRPALQQALATIRQISERWETSSSGNIPEPHGRQVQALKSVFPLLETALQTALDGEEILQTLSSVLETDTTDTPLTVSLIHALSTAQPLFQDARQGIYELNEQLAQTGLMTADQSAEVQQVVQQFEAMLDLALILPSLLGNEGKREYLLISQNPDEMRPTGGFISNFGILSVEGGKLDIPSLVDSSLVDAERLWRGPYVQSPESLKRTMGAEQWAFRDANWSPGFPTSARAALHLYNISQGAAIANVIAFDPFLMKLLLAATGPMQVETVDGHQHLISADNIWTFLRGQYSVGLQSGNKDRIIDPLFTAMISTTLASPPSNVDLLSLAQAFISALNGHHLLIFVDEEVDPDVAAILARRGWDGAVRPGTNDFLMVVQSNVGCTKSNASIKQSLNYTVDLEHLAEPLATLLVQYEHTSEPREQCIPPLKGGGVAPAGNSYRDMTEDCYWNYLQVLVPTGATLLETAGNPTPAEWLYNGIADDGSITITNATTRTDLLSTLLVVPMGAERVATFHYQLPPGVLTNQGDTWSYHLRIQKQGGHEMIPMALQVRLPPGATLLSTSVPMKSQQEGLLSFSLELRQDMDLTVRFRGW